MDDAAVSRVTHVTVLVADADEALDWYTRNLGFEKRVDESFEDGRWLTVAPTGQSGLEIVLMEPNAGDEGRVGEGTMWVLETDDCRALCEQLRERGVDIVSEPEDMAWGVSAIIEDLYGNPFNLVESREPL